MNSTSFKECDAESDRSSNGHIRKNESDAFTKRILDVVGEEPLHAFARRCGVGESTLRNIIKSGAWPRTDNLVAIADTANVNIEWLASGRGPKQRGAASNAEELSNARAINLRNSIMHGLNPSQPSSGINIDDIARLTLAIEAVEEGLDGAYRTLPPEKRAKLIAAAYDLLIDMEQKDNVIKFIKLAA